MVPQVGPETVSGSSRLKAGTAQKMILNMLSTCVMTRLGKIQGNLMVRVTPTNHKLRERAVRIVAKVLRLEKHEAEKQLEKANWDMSKVIR